MYELENGYMSLSLSINNSFTCIIDAEEHANDNGNIIRTKEMANKRAAITKLFKVSKSRICFY